MGAGTFVSFPTGKRSRQLVEQLNLRTGQFTGFSRAASSLVIGNTRPSGKQILIQGHVDLLTSKATPMRISLSGKPLKALWRAAGIGSAAYSPDGQNLVTDSYGSLVMLSNSGAVAAA